MASATGTIGRDIQVRRNEEDEEKRRQASSGKLSQITASSVIKKPEQIEVSNPQKGGMFSRMSGTPVTPSTSANTIGTPISFKTKQQELQSTPVDNGKWYKGEFPTLSETYARGMDIYKDDQVALKGFMDTLDTLRNTPGELFYQPYATGTNNAIAELRKLGYDIPDTQEGVTQWLASTEYMVHNYRTKTGTTPLAPAKGSTKAQDAAYWRYQLLQSQDKSLKVSAQWDALQEEIAYWVGRDDLNLSDQDILDRIKWSKYKDLDDLDTSASDGVPIKLNWGTTYSKDNLLGVIWAARNGGSTGSIYMDAAYESGGRGVVWKDNPEISQRLEPKSDRFNPYYVTSTLEDAGLYFGVKGFDQQWIDANREMRGSADATEKKYYGAVIDAEATTKAAEDELVELNEDKERLIQRYHDDPDTAIERLEQIVDEYSTLSKMQKSLKDGDLLGTTRPIKFDLEEMKAEVRRRCAEVQADNPVANGDKMAASMGDTTPTSETDAAVAAATDAKLSAASGTIEQYGTESEKAQSNWLRTTSANAQRFLSKYTNATPTPEQAATALSEVDAKAAYKGYLDIRASMSGYEDKQQEVTDSKAALEKLESNEQYKALQEKQAKREALDSLEASEYDKSMLKSIAATGDKEAFEDYFFGNHIADNSDYFVDDVWEAAQPSDWSNEDQANWENYNARIKELQASIDEGAQYLEQNKATYEEQSKKREDLAKQYFASAQLANALGVKGGNGVELAWMDYIYNIGSKYEPDQWLPYSIYDAAVAKGETDAAGAAAYATSDIRKGNNEINALETVLSQIKEFGINVPDGYMENIQRRINSLKRENRDARYYLLDSAQDFGKVVADQKEYYKNLDLDYNMPSSVWTCAYLAGNTEATDRFFADGLRDAQSNWLVHPESLAYLSDEEKNRLFYLTSDYADESNRTAKAEDYLNFLADGEYGALSVRGLNQLTGRIQNDIENGGFWESFGWTAMSFLTNLASVEGTVYSVESALLGNTINPSNQHFWSTVATGVARQAVTEKIGSAVEDVTSSEALKWAATTGYGIFYNGIDSWISGKLTAPFLNNLGVKNAVLNNWFGASPMGLRAFSSAVR